MNTPIRSAYFDALLADASYVEGLRREDTGLELANKLVGARRFTLPLANAVGAEFRVITQFTDPGVSGFSVTVFADRSGTQYISFRGTESVNDWANNFDAFFISGLGRSQVVAMVNWYLRASAPSGAEVVQVLYPPLVDQITGEVLTRTFVAQGEGTLPAAGSYLVNGHSLGGSTSVPGIRGDPLVKVGAATAPAREVLSWCAAHGYVLFTHDLDFGAILAASEARKPSVVQLRSENVVPEAALEHVASALQQVEEELEQGALVAIERGRHRVRLLPLTRAPA